MQPQSEEQFIEWKDERYSTNIERFDDQHQRLFSLLNDLYVAMDEGHSDDKVGEILRELEDYTEYHFGDEEEFMQDCGFAMDCSECFFNHREMHEEFAQKVSDLREKHENGEYITMEVLMFVRDWLDSHIAGLNQDQNYAEYYLEDVPDDYEYSPGQLKKGRADAETVPESRPGEQSPDEVTLGSEVHQGEELTVPSESMAAWVERLAEEHGDGTVARVYRDGGLVDHSFQELYDEASQIAAGLLEDGLEPGDRLGIHVAPRYDWLVLDVACYLAGFVSVPVPQLYRDERAAHVAADADVDLLVTDTTLSPALGEAVDAVRERDDLPEGDPAALPDIDTAPDDIATIVYRLGTTDHPNGCAITHRNLRAATAMLGSALPVGTGQAGTSFLPLAHMYQRVLTYYLLDNGCAVAFVDPEELVDGLNAVEPAVLVGVPEVYRRLFETIQDRTDEISGLKQALSDGIAGAYGAAKDAGDSFSTGQSLKYKIAERTVFGPLRSELGLSNVEYALTGTEAIDPDIVQFFRGFGVPLSEIYGATEVSGLVSINRAGSYRAGEVGAPFPGVEVALSDDDEILVRGPNVIDSYWKETADWQRNLREGWYHTGDLGEFDEDGGLSVRGPK
jgi:hemerythrin-like metal-binding protein